jgi:hypothetical protein
VDVVKERRQENEIRDCMILRDHVIRMIHPLDPCTDLKTVPKVLRNVIHPHSRSAERKFAEAAPETIWVRREFILSFRPFIWRLETSFRIIVGGGQMHVLYMLLKKILAVEGTRSLMLGQADLDVVLVEMIHVIDSIGAEYALHTWP